MLKRTILLFSLSMIGILAWLEAHGQTGAENPDALPPGAIRRLGNPSWRHAGRVGFAAFLPGGKSIVSVGDDFTMRLWEFPSGVEIRRTSLPVPLKPDPGEGPKKFEVVLPDKWGLTAAALSKDGTILATYFERDVIRLHEVATGKELRGLGKPREDNMHYSALVFGDDGTKLIAGIANGSVEEWDTKTGLLIQTLAKGRVIGTSHSDPGESHLSLSPDGNTLLIWGNGKSVQLRDIATGRDLTGNGGNAAKLLSIQFTPDSQEILTIDTDMNVNRWKTADGRLLTSAPLRGTPLRDAVNFGDFRGYALSPDGRTLAIMESNKLGNRVVILDVAAGKALAKIDVPLTPPGFPLEFSIAYSPDGKKIVTRGYASEPLFNPSKLVCVDIIDIPSAKVIHSFTVEPPAAEAKGKKKAGGGVMMGGLRRVPTAPVFSADGTHVAAFIGNGTFQFRDATTGILTASLLVPELQEMRSVAFSHDARCFLVDPGGDAVTLFELATGRPRQSFGEKIPPAKKTGALLTRSEDAVYLRGPSMALSPDGRLLAVVTKDGTVPVWDILTGQQLAAFKDRSQGVSAVAFAPAGKTLASASGADTSALIWDLSKAPRPAPLAKMLTQAELENSWQTLTSPNAAEAWTAIKALIAAPQATVALIADQVKCVAPPRNVKEIEGWMRELDDTQFKVREKAKSELTKLRELILPAIDRALAAGPTLEARNRLEALRREISQIPLEGDRLRAYRAVEILECIGSAEAKRVLESLAEGAPGALITISARQALNRVGSFKR
jgi:WD40 repeat protein